VTAFLDSTSISSGRRSVPPPANDDGVVHNLFAFPAEDNFAGEGGMLGGIPGPGRFGPGAAPAPRML
jgi:hypothetical protein